MKQIGHWINGKHVPGTSGRFADVFNPATGEVQAQVALATKAELDAATADAAKAQVKWGATNPQRRARVMMEFVRLLNRDMEKLATVLSSEHGKVIADAKGDVQRGLEVIAVLGAPGPWTGTTAAIAPAARARTPASQHDRRGHLRAPRERSGWQRP